MEELLLKLMETEDGRKFVMKLLEFSGVENGSFQPDPYGNAWLMGRASVGAAILDALRNSERGIDLEAIMRREARYPPDKSEEDFYRQFKEGDEE